MARQPTDRDLAALFNRFDRLNRNRSGTVTLTANVASTTVEDPTVTPNSVLSFDPLTPNARDELWKNGTMFVAEADRARGQFIITHANNAQTDRTFFWIAGGG